MQQAREKGVGCGCHVVFGVEQAHDGLGHEALPRERREVSGRFHGLHIARQIRRASVLVHARPERQPQPLLGGYSRAYEGGATVTS